MKKDYSRNVEIMCPLCGGKTFEYDEENDESPVKCLGCNTVYDREKLIEENQQNLEANINEIGKEVLQDTAEEMKSMLKKMFGKNKNFKIK